METRGNRQNYFPLNDGYDSEALPEDRLSSPIPGSLSPETTECEILPSESISQSSPILTTINSSDSNSLPSAYDYKSKKRAWFWDYFGKTEVPHEWYEKKKQRLIDTKIQCSIID